MAIGPREIPSFVITLINEAEPSIDRRLTVNWSSAEPKPEFEIRLWNSVPGVFKDGDLVLNEQHQEALNKLIDRYKSAGWQVEATSDHIRERDGRGKFSVSLVFSQ